MLQEIHADVLEIHGSMNQPSRDLLAPITPHDVVLRNANNERQERDENNTVVGFIVRVLLTIVDGGSLFYPLLSQLGKVNLFDWFLNMLSTFNNDVQE
jgi:hypothetical protein